MSKHTLAITGDKVWGYLKKGVDAIAIPVSKTLGPEAGSTLMYRTFNRGPRLIDDGYYTAEGIEPKDPHVRLVAEFYKEAISRTNKKVGDGTSTTSSVAHSLFNHIYCFLYADFFDYHSAFDLFGQI